MKTNEIYLQNLYFVTNLTLKSIWLQKTKIMIKVNDFPPILNIISIKILFN